MGNVLLIGNSGVGKSTLLNAVLGSEAAVASWGITGTTKECKKYGTEADPFCIIDSMGFEPGFVERYRAIRSIQKWSENSTKKVDDQNRINVIWFCVDGTSRKLFSDAVAGMAEATRIWKSVPIVVVITKSYAKPERSENIEMVRQAIARHPRVQKNVRGIIPVVAGTYPIDDSTFVAPCGISELIEATVSLMPEGEVAALNDSADYIIGRKKVLSQSAVFAATVAAAATGAVPAPEVDALALAPIETAQVKTIAKIFGVEKSDQAKKFIESIVEVGSAAIVAKALISSLKAVPGINLPASILNAVASAAIVAAIGQGSIIAFEKIYRGEESLDNIDWVKEFIQSLLGDKLTTSAVQAAESVDQNTGADKVASTVVESIANCVIVEPASAASSASS